MAPTGEPGGFCLTGLSERKAKEGSGNRVSLINLILAAFLDSDYVRSLSLGIILNFC
jgi:hypothetical protein